MNELSPTSTEPKAQHWFTIGRLSDIPRRGARQVLLPRGPIAVFRTQTDEVYAIDDKCPHKGGPLSQGIVHDGAVTCPLHNWVIDLQTGDAMGADQGCVRTYEVRKDADGLVSVSLSGGSGKTE
ncbi:nitrite reductase small subunit NirD [Nisaea denitrificans]|uniref:nitrite reductase small subunit NirD n=1 Tax=Nisaea denitrificans TaxID=390877 RepID=UPI0003FB504E|nr:nitrite reductase small subunit NirD [Nisaea denitrificans]|tara:strand:- start:693 stop:1064 length:372 start_codon:yes stop_codon:yes gene_type:complete